MKQIVSKDRQILAAFLGVMILMTILIIGMPAKAFAAETDADQVLKAAGKTVSYKYRVEVYAGRQGRYDGKKVWRKSFPPGSNIAIDVRDCKVINDKYYIRGFRVAGHDNDETTGYQTITIDNLNSDVSYEVAYGIKGAMVQYTVEYVDEKGNELLDSETFYGMAGDKPVVAYRYVDGFMPHALNIGKTLSEDESQNVFTFKYSKQTSATTTVTRYVNATAPGTPGNPAGTGAAGGAGNAGGNGGNGGAAINDGGVPLAQPNQYQDLDEGNTPQDAGVVNGVNIVPYLVGGGIGLLILILLILMLLRRRRHAAEDAEATEGANA